MIDATLTYTDHTRWNAIIARNCDLDFEKMHRRKFARYDVVGAMAIMSIDSIPEEAECNRPLTLTLLDISPEGVQARSFERYPYDTRVTLRVYVSDDEALLRGRVIHCTGTLGGFKLGVELLF